MIENLTIFSILKNTSYLAAFVVSLNWIGFNPQSLGIFAILMVIDVITGVVRVRRCEGEKSITSHNGKVGVMKKLLGMTALFTIGLTGKGVGFDMSAMVQASVTVLILAESYSILGNIHSYTTGKPKVEFDAISFILNSFRKLLDRYII